MIYDLMLELPIFQGLSHDQFTEIIEKVPFRFKKFRSNEYLVRSGDACDKLMFVLSGSVRVITPIFNNRITITEDFDAPFAMPFYYLFGRETTMRCSAYAEGAVGAMAIDKDHFMDMIECNRLMLINVLNILSTHAQIQHIAMDSIGEHSPGIKLASWLLSYTTRNAKNITVTARQIDWFELFGLDESAFFAAIRALEDIGLIEYDKGKLKLIDRYSLRTYVTRNMARK